MALERETPDVLVSDIRMPGIDGMDLLQRVNQSYPNLPVIIMTAHSDLDAAVNSYKKEPLITYLSHLMSTTHST